MRPRRKGLAEETYAAISLCVSSPDRIQLVWIILWMITHLFYIREAGMTWSSFDCCLCTWSRVSSSIPSRVCHIGAIVHRILLCTIGDPPAWIIGNAPFAAPGKSTLLSRSGNRIYVRYVDKLGLSPQHHLSERDGCFRTLAHTTEKPVYCDSGTWCRCETSLLITWPKTAYHTYCYRQDAYFARHRHLMNLNHSIIT